MMFKSRVCGGSAANVSG